MPQPVHQCRGRGDIVVELHRLHHAADGKFDAFAVVGRNTLLWLEVELSGTEGGHLPEQFRAHSGGADDPMPLQLADRVVGIETQSTLVQIVLLVRLLTG